jgi:hypothetical protein
MKYQKGSDLKAFSLLGAKQKAPLEMTAWKEASASGIDSMSPWTNLTLLQCLAWMPAVYRIFHRAL